MDITNGPELGDATPRYTPAAESNAIMRDEIYLPPALGADTPRHTPAMESHAFSRDEIYPGAVSDTDTPQGTPTSDSNAIPRDEIHFTPASDASTAQSTPIATPNMPMQDEIHVLPLLPGNNHPIPALAFSDDLSSNDADSGFADQILSTASVTSSIFDYEHEHGRTYHAFRRGKYVMPNDEREQDRMDIHYHGLRIILGDRHYLSPIRLPTAILDIGTGTGIWAMDVADDHPQALVIGADLSPIQPCVIPPNLEFQIMDADEPWDFHQRFDLVHTRLMNGFSIRSWPFFYEQAYASMRPGGWVENQEFDLDFTCDDGTQQCDGAVRQWQALWNEGITRMGLCGRCYPYEMKQQMEAAGFINVSVTSYKWPVGLWPRDKRLRQAGACMVIGMAEGVSGLSQRVFTRALGWSVEEMEVMLIDVRKELSDVKVHSYLPIHVVCGQKPPWATP